MATMRTQLRTSTALRGPCPTRSTVSRRPAVQVRADWISEAWMRIFTPNKTDAPAVINEYSGRMPQHGKRRPFKDGYSASKGNKTSTKEVVQNMAAEATDKGEGVLEYIGKAVKRVMSNNFTNDKESVSTGAAGWKGNVRHRSREGERKGFHSNQY